MSTKISIPFESRDREGAGAAMWGRIASCGRFVIGLLFAALLTATPTLANPVDFGRSELNAALSARGINTAKIRITAEIAADPPESYRIEGNRIFGGDLRGLMYGLLEAAGQIRTAGKLSNTQGHRAVPIRGIRMTLENPAAWRSDDYWTAFVRMLARNRFNRLNIVFGEDPARLEIRKLRWLSQLAADHGIEFTLGLVYADIALQALLRDCPAIRGVHIRESAVSEGLLQAIRESGRLVKLDIPASLAKQGLIQTAKAAGVPLRIAAEYGARGSFMDLLQREPVNLTPDELTPLPMINGLPKAPVLPRPYEVYWSQGSHSVWLWGDPEYVRRGVSMFTISDTQGFEIGAPVAPVFTGTNKHRVAWTHDFERYWLLYTLWGRLSYDPHTPDRVWMHELERRFGASASSVLRAYRSSSRIQEELTGENDRVASPEEAVRNRINGTASARQAPIQRSAKLHALVRDIQQALTDIQKTPAAAAVEWLSSETDFEVLASIAQYHARKLTAADHLASYDIAGSDAGLYAARRELAGAAAIWKRIAGLIDSVYAVKPWLEPPPYVDAIDERIRVMEQAADRTSSSSPAYTSTRAEQHWPEEMPRPAIDHTAPPMFEVGKPLVLALNIAPSNSVRSVRLHYRAVNELENFRTLDTDARATVRFEIPPENLPAHYDLMYYFELLHDRYGGWFYPDPVVSAPYFVSKVAKR